MEIIDLIRTARETAQAKGSGQVTLAHLSSGQVDELAQWTIEFLRTRPSVQSEIMPGWRTVRAMDAGVLKAWVHGLDLTEREVKRVQPMRTELYDLLEERGLIFKPPGTGSSIHVSPDDASATTDFPDVPGPVKKSNGHADLRAAVESELRSRVAALCSRIATETSLDPTDYWAVTTSERPLDVLVRLINSNAERGTFKRLGDIGRLDLTLDAALVGWTDLPLQQDLIDEGAARVDWWS